MKRILGWFGAGLSMVTAAADHHEAVAARMETLRRSALASPRGMQRLTELCDGIGPRLSGSTNLEAAITWALTRLKEDGFVNVRGEPVPVPHWVRGEESLEELSPRSGALPVLGLGGTTNTAPGGLLGSVLVVTNFQELTARAAEAAGRIVLLAPPFSSYGDTVRYRTRGAIEVAKVGGIACLVRSVTPFSLRTPHTGAMIYEEGVPRIPTAAVSVEDAERLRRAQAAGREIRVRLRLGARALPDAMSHNVIAEIRGREHPEEVVLVGGHLDSWDVGQGALDDGGGCIAAWEALRWIRETGPAPRRTVRLILWTNEENGLRGAKAYPETHRDSLARHVVAIESDTGIGPVSGFSFTGSDRAMEQLRTLLPHLEALGAAKLRTGAGGSDLGPLVRAGVPIMDLWTDRRDYFWFHHSDADTLDKVDPGELNRCTAALAVMVYGIAELPEPLVR